MWGGGGSLCIIPPPFIRYLLRVILSKDYNISKARLACINHHYLWIGYTVFFLGGGWVSKFLFTFTMNNILRLLTEGLGNRQVKFKLFAQDAIAHTETLGLISVNGYFSCPTCRERGRRFTQDELRQMNRQKFEKKNLFFPGIHNILALAYPFENFVL